MKNYTKFVCHSLVPKILHKRFLLPVLFILVSACHPDKDIQPVDPCSGQVANPLSFKVMNSVGGGLFESDSVFIGTVVLEAPVNYSSFKWSVSVGNDPRVFSSQRFTVDFNHPVGSTNIRLIAQRALNLRCFPKDDGIDTLNRTLTVLPLNSLGIPPTAVEGRFQGANSDAPKDTFTIKIYRKPMLTDPSQTIIVLSNLNKGCLTSDVNVIWGYKGLAFYQQNPGYAANGCDYVSGTGFLQPDNRNIIRLQYNQRSSSSASSISREFIGHRK